MPMIATTIINSMRVKPFCTAFIEWSPKRLGSSSGAKGAYAGWLSKAHAKGSARA
jgi:hypothetical protein